MHQHVAEGLNEEQLIFYREIQRVLSSARSARREDLRRLMSIIEDLSLRLQQSKALEIPDGYELRWTISDDILEVPAPELIKVVDIDELNQGTLPLQEEDAA